MAAIDDWVKVEKSTARKPEVLQIASALGIHPDQAFGLCVRFWMWVDDNLSRDCRAIVTTENAIDTTVGRDGFTRALIAAGWLELSASELRIPHFDRHLSKSSKKRAENSRRQRECRASENDSSQSGSDSVTDLSRMLRDQEKNKRRIRKKDSTTPVVPTGDDDEKREIVEAIYAAYPRQVAKPAALRAIRKALETIDGTALLGLTEAYAVARAGADPQFTPHPATWFNGQRYADDPATWKPSSASVPVDLFAGIREFANGGNQDADQ